MIEVLKNILDKEVEKIDKEFLFWENYYLLKL